MCVFDFIIFFFPLQQIKKLQLLTQSAALNRETIAASQLATSKGSGSNGGNSQATSSATSGDSSTTLTASSSGGGSGPTSTGSNAAGGTGGAAGKLQANRSNSNLDGGGGATSILTVDEDTLSLDRLNSLRIYMTSVKTLPFNLRIYG